MTAENRNGADGTKNTAERRKHRRKRFIAAVAVCGAVILVAGIAVTALMLYSRSQMQKIPAMSFEDCLAYTLGGSGDGVITVGIIRNGEASYTVYGKDGEALPDELHTYEIGSLTKTFTAALVQRAVTDGKISLDGTLDDYLTLPAGNLYPTIAGLLTHTSGYKGYYLEAPSTGNFFAGRNDFCGITDGMILKRLGTLRIKEKNYPFVYSNFGYAALGCVLESVYGEEYTTLVNNFAAELGLSATHISSGKNELRNGWDWRENDAYMSAGALVSNIEDMLKYAQYQLDGGEPFGECHKVIREINASSGDNKLMDINQDSVGMAWITDSENGIVWHNGGTGNYNCYLGFRPGSGTAVVILSNLSPSCRIPATVMGVKLLNGNG